MRQVAVLGAGVMGAQIAAHLANANVPVLLFDLPAKEGDPNGIVRKAIDNLGKLEPSPIAGKTKLAHIEAANYDQDLGRLGECDLVIEAIAERLDLKKSLYERIAPHLGADAALVTNTSGLSIRALSGVLPAPLKPRFCGVHFFNPPRYMYLVELIPAPGMNLALLDSLEAFLTTTLGKGVIRAKDTPNFIANRVGVFSILAAFHHTKAFGLGFDEVDAITGSLLGRPKSATYRTADVVGLDTLSHVVNTMREGLKEDPWHPHFQLPAWYQGLLEQGALGQKTQRGVYRKLGKDIQVLDPNTKEYRASEGKADPGVAEILKLRDAAERLSALRVSSHPQAKFLWACIRDMLHYCAVHLASIADNARDLDLAVRWGFGWNQGPFELWQEAGWHKVAGWIASDIAAGKTLAKTPLPAWAMEDARAGTHRVQGSYDPASGSYTPRRNLSVYRRQPYPDALAGEERKYGDAIIETSAVRLWHAGDDIGVLSFKSKMHTIGEDVLEGIQQAIEESESRFAGLVMWQTEPPFSLGANLSGPSARPEGASKPSALGKMFKSFRKEAQAVVLKAARKLNVADALMAGRLEKVESVVALFQDTTSAWKYAKLPTVAAVDGMALGGGCEFVMHSARVVASLESYIGLVEAGVGLLPAGGGCKELALRAAEDAKGGDLFPFIRRYFETVAKADVSRSAEQAKELGYLRPSDPIVMNRFELLHVAKWQARALAETGYRAPLPARDIPVAGRNVIATFKAHLANLLEGQYISEHDRLVTEKIAYVLCGGDLDAGTLVDERWFLELERQCFMELLATEKTQARIEHTLKTGKPLRN
ncbi:MAG: 3-hydroxyacyl-CoA dehydrogenase/enoyl-CoA hydratase family protein [Burkholderiales bacterium]